MNAEDDRFHVHGVVTNGDGREASGAEVILWWQRIRGRVRLAHGKASEEGAYSLRYRMPDDAPGKILLVVEAKGGKLAKPLESAQTTAAPDLTINLTAPPADPSQYATLLNSITPLCRT